MLALVAIARFVVFGEDGCPRSAAASVTGNLGVQTGDDRPAALSAAGAVQNEPAAALLRFV